jgi:putative nucleotidyltransferase with HDIG domain
LWQKQSFGFSDAPRVDLKKGYGSLMTTSGGFGKQWERPRRQWYLSLLRDLRSGLSWRDAVIGLLAVIAVSLILIGFRHQSIPKYEAGQIANRDVRAFQDVVYNDAAATELKRAEAEAAIPALYQIETDLIDDRVKSLASAFSKARDILAKDAFSEENSDRKANRAELLKELQEKLNETFPKDTLEVLLRYDFSPMLENSLLRLLNDVMRDGIVGDRSELSRDYRSGIMVRDGTTAAERLLQDIWQKRDISGAREFLRQAPLNIPGLSAREKATLVQYLESLLTPTLIFDREETLRRRQEAADKTSPVEVRIKQDQIIVRADERVTEKTQQQLDVLRNLGEPQLLFLQAIGYFIIATILIYTLWRYFFYYQTHYQTRVRRIRSRTVLILCVLVFEIVVLRVGAALADILTERFQGIQDSFVLYYGIPLAFGAILVTLLVDINLGLMSSIILALIAGLFYGRMDIAVYIMIGCSAGIYSIRQYKDRAAILKSGLTIGVANILTLAALSFLRQSPRSLTEMLAIASLALLNGVLASTLASILLPALEAAFQTTTDVRLLELSNLNSHVLRRLAVEAPGTYHHSLMLATFAEAAAESIEANPLLVRVGAYYHDIGKLAKPEYFVENQSYGSNKHEELSPSMSRLIISNHVKDGLNFARMAGLPPRISSMIPQHHGTRIMTFFYKKALDAAGGDKSKVVDADFRYPGPRPQSREAAILMMADSVEAASRTLGEAPVPAQIEGMIDRVVEAIVADGQLDECDITLRDIRRVKDSFFKIIAGSLHHRIEYPGYDFKNKKEGSGNGSGMEPSAAHKD